VKNVTVIAHPASADQTLNATPALSGATFMDIPVAQAVPPAPMDPGYSANATPATQLVKPAPEEPLLTAKHVPKVDSNMEIHAQPPVLEAIMETLPNVFAANAMVHAQGAMVLRPTNAALAITDIS
jgi:hypothetical protein